MKLAFIVLAHHHPAQLARLLTALGHRDTRTYLHIDRRVPIEPFRSQLTQQDLAQLEMLPRQPSRWGGIGPVDAAMDGLRHGLAESCDYFVLLSGQDYPLWPIGQILEFFAEAPERSYVAHFPLPDPRWEFDGRMRTDFYTYDLLGRRETCFPKGETVHLTWKGKVLNSALRLRTAWRPPRRFPAYARPYGGSQWWNLSREAAEFVIRFTGQHPAYRAYHLHTLAPDEIFFHSILLGTRFAEAHEIVNDSLRFMIWPPNSSHPRLLGSEDLPKMMRSGKPFARKFDLDHDRSVVDKLPA